MKQVPFSKISAPINTLLAVLGLFAVAALTTPGPSDAMRVALHILLACVWAAYALQLAGDFILGLKLRDATPALAVDLIAVIVPLAGFLLDGGRDQYLYCSVWLLKPLRD